MKLRIYIAILFFFCNSAMNGQESCPMHRDHNSTKSILTDGIIHSKQYGNQRRNVDTATYTIPIVFHIAHNTRDSLPGMNSNITDSTIHAAIKSLNEIFSNKGSAFNTDGVDIKIQFKLATVNGKCGGPTTGILRYPGNSFLSFYKSNNVMRVNNWNSNNYLNIFTGTGIEYFFPVNGLSSFPENHGNEKDAILMVYTLINDLASQKILAHEVGHYLGLYHTFSYGCKNDDCSIDGDMVCDTPPDTTNTPYTNCDSVLNSCNSDTDDTSSQNPFRAINLGGLGDQNDLQNNLMDYLHNDCYAVFTQGQKKRMRSTLTSIRSSLLSSSGLGTPCDLNICTDFNNSIYKHGGNVIYMYDNQYVNLTNTTDTGNKYEWFINDSLYSTKENFTWFAEDIRDHKLEFCVSDSVSKCKTCKTNTIRVRCSVNPIIKAILDTAQLGDSIGLNYLIQAYPYGKKVTWYVNNDSISNYPWINYAFNKAGWNYIKFKLSNQKCSKFTLDSIYIICDSSIDFTLLDHKDSVNIGEEVMLGLNTNLDTSEWILEIENGYLIKRTDSSVSIKFNKSGAQEVVFKSKKCGGFILKISNFIVNELNTAINAIRSSTISIYPNPSKGFVRINTQLNRKYSLSLINLNGEIIINDSMMGEKNLDLQQLPKGIYTLIVEAKGERNFFKIIKI